MNDAGRGYILGLFFGFKTAKDAKEKRESIGDEYLPVFDRTFKHWKFTRTLNQNALLHMHYGEIAEALSMTAEEVKGQCHHKYGLPIKLRDEQFAWVWNQTGAKLPYDKQCAYLASGVLNVSSTMAVPELREYMDAMQKDYTEAGIRLTHPEDR